MDVLRAGLDVAERVVLIPVGQLVNDRRDRRSGFAQRLPPQILVQHDGIGDVVEVAASAVVRVDAGRQRNHHRDGGGALGEQVQDLLGGDLLQPRMQQGLR